MKQGGQGALALQTHKKSLWVLGAREALVLGPAPASCQALSGVCQAWGQNSFSLIPLQLL